MELALVFGGVAVSLLVQWLKKAFGTAKVGTMTIVVVLALVGGIGFQLLSHYGLWEAFIQVLVSAGAFYAFIVKNVSKEE